MEREFIDEMLERLLVVEKKTFGETFELIIKERATQIVDLGRIENAYQLFCKKHPKADKTYFRKYIQLSRPKDFAICVRYFDWE